MCKLRGREKPIMFMTNKQAVEAALSVGKGHLSSLRKSKQTPHCKVSEYAYCLCFVSKFRVVELEFFLKVTKFIERSFKDIICSAASFPFRDYPSFACRDWKAQGVISPSPWVGTLAGLVTRVLHAGPSDWLALGW